ncbi:MAG: nucleoside phosphorylase [Chitinophagales bacterium]|nr:nucleoside phosphorylase [Chitinophagales bacterium]
MEHLNPRQLGDAELLITQKGNIYHLGIAPQHLADTVITVGDPARVPVVSKYFDKITHRSAHREFVCHTGYIGKKQVMVVSSGIGPDNMDIVMNELDALANIDFNTKRPVEHKRTLSIIRLGTCGSLQADIAAGSMITSSYGIGLDNLLHYYKMERNADERFIMDGFMQHTRLQGSAILPYIAEGSIALRKYFAKEYIQGITVTCPGFYAPQGRAIRGQLNFPYLVDAMSTFSTRDLRVTNFEMETAAMYGLGKVLGHRCCSISMVVNNRINNTMSHNIDADIEYMIKHTLSIIEHI